MENLGIIVKGRGKLYATATAVVGGVLIRLDDEKNLEFWGEIFLPTDTLEELVKDAKNQID